MYICIYVYMCIYIYGPKGGTPLGHLYCDRTENVSVLRGLSSLHLLSTFLCPLLLPPLFYLYTSLYEYL